MKIIEQKNKIIALEKFFKQAATRLKEKTNLEKIHFLVLNKKNKNFVTKYSTCGSYISLSEKKLYYFTKNSKKNIFYLKKLIRHYNFFNFINCDTHMHYTVILPIYHDNEIICLILFSDHLAADWFNKYNNCIKILVYEIASCLEAIILYNQALERITGTYNCLRKRSCGQTD